MIRELWKMSLDSWKRLAITCIDLTQDITRDVTNASQEAIRKAIVEHNLNRGIQLVAHKEIYYLPNGDYLTLKLLNFSISDKTECVYLNHLLGLSLNDRIWRFGSITSDETIEKHVLKVASSDNIVVIGAYAMGELVGAAEAGLSGIDMEFALSVDADHRRQGIGKRLNEYMIGLSAKLGLKAVFVQIKAGNTPMRAISAHSGFVSEISCGEVSGTLDLTAPDQRARTMSKLVASLIP